MATSVEVGPTGNLQGASGIRAAALPDMVWRVEWPLRGKGSIDMVGASCTAKGSQKCLSWFGSP